MTESESSSRFRMSVIVASTNARPTIDLCLDSIVAQIDQPDIELIVVDNSTDGTDEYVARHFGGVRLLVRPGLRYTPQLWSEGIRASSGSVIALTTADFCPAPNWIVAMLDAHGRAAIETAGVGGTFEQHSSGRIRDRAVFFVRYSPFLAGSADRHVQDIAADNASYRRSVIDRYEHVWSSGFWEPDVHREMKRDGVKLLLTDHVRTSHVRSYGVRAFIRNRFAHGRQHGASRAAGRGLPRRLAYVVSAPLVPLVMTFRAAKNVRARSSNMGRFIQALPLIVLFYTSWAVGEAAGSLTRRAAS